MRIVRSSQDPLEFEASLPARLSVAAFIERGESCNDRIRRVLQPQSNRLNEFDTSKLANSFVGIAGAESNERGKCSCNDHLRFREVGLATANMMGLLS